MVVETICKSNTYKVQVILVFLQLAEDIAAKDAAREEMERIRMELVLEEQEEKERQKERVGGSKYFKQKNYHNS